jgi:hypothetical protein
MRIQKFQDDEIESIARGNVDAFFYDLAADPHAADITKNLRGFREEVEIDRGWEQFKENCELASAGGPEFSNHNARLRSERHDNPDDPGEPLTKRASCPKDVMSLRGEPNTTRKCNGWTILYGPDGGIVRAYANSVDPELAFANL